MIQGVTGLTAVMDDLNEKEKENIRKGKRPCVHWQGPLCSLADITLKCLTHSAFQFFNPEGGGGGGSSSRRYFMLKKLR